MSVKNEHCLNSSPEVKIKIELSDNCEDDSEIHDDTANVTKTVNSEPEAVAQERPIFVCTNCKMTERYDCFGDRVRFNRSMSTKVDYYLTRDPFTHRDKRQFLILGSVCSICDKDVCVKPECSIFYSNFFCSDCARKNIAEFPPCIQERIKSTKRI